MAVRQAGSADLSRNLSAADLGSAAKRSSTAALPNPAAHRFPQGRWEQYRSGKKRVDKLFCRIEQKQGFGREIGEIHPRLIGRSPFVGGRAAEKEPVALGEIGMGGEAGGDRHVENGHVRLAQELARPLQP